ncbi:MAG: hypothetical protein ABSD90_08700 [Methylocystis sp.]|jgi:hypothetical protein
MIFRSTTLAALTLCAVSALPARAEPSGYERVISTVTLSFGDDGSTDRAVLVDNFDAGADLYIFRSIEDAKPDSPMNPTLVKKAAAWNGAMWGSRPSLDTNAKNSLIVKSQNDAIGRDRWSETLTIVYRRHEFLVAGLTYESHDNLDPRAGGSCDLNFLSGKGVRNGKPVEIKSGAVRLIRFPAD